MTINGLATPSSHPHIALETQVALGQHRSADAKCEAPLRKQRSLDMADSAPEGRCDLTKGS
jgi:hypothetical protein